MAAQGQQTASRRSVLQSGVALGAGLVLPGLMPGAWSPATAADPASAYEFSALQYEKDVALTKYAGKVTVVVNIASEWPLQNVNYPGLRTLLERYGQDGFTVVAFPCNQFGGQAPYSSDEEREYAYKKFGVRTFDIFDKIEVNGPGAHPLYKFMRAQQPASFPGGRPAGREGDIEWNYTKFLIGRDGQTVKRYKPSLDPLDFEGDVRLALAGKAPLPAECIMHPGRKGCKVEKLLAA